MLPWSSLTAAPWRNGGGVTRQILSRQLSAGGVWEPATDDWDWRLSIADVTESGAFSSFPGMTRILTVIEGDAVTLAVDGEVVELSKHCPFRFDGEAETSALVSHGPIRDLNLIARTGVVAAHVEVERLSANTSRLISEGQYGVILDGNARLSSPRIELAHFDTVLGESPHPPIITGEAVIAVITVSPAA